MRPLRSMPENLEPTRATLHAYALAVGALPRVHATQHEQWWHASLSLDATGFRTDSMPLPDGGTASIVMDLRSHEIVVETTRHTEARLNMMDGMTGTEMADALIGIAQRLGLESDYVRSKFESDAVPEYDEAVAQAYLETMNQVHVVLDKHRGQLPGQVGPLQVWPHGFDLAFECFGTKRVKSEDGGETATAAAQLNLGFYPAGDAYFYSNPWPFDPVLLEVDLPAGEWRSEGWQGSILPYSAVAERSDGVATVAAYAAGVFDAAYPTLID